MRDNLFWVVAALCGLCVPLVAPGYTLHVATTALIACVAVLGLNVTFGWAGQITLAQAGFLGVGAYITAILSTRYGTPVWLSAPAGIVGTMVLAAILGLPILRLKGHYLALATLGFNVTFIVIATGWREFLGGSDGIVSIPRPTILVEVSSERSFYYLALAVVAIGIVIATRLRQSHVGRAMIAVRDDEIAAASASIPVVRTKLQAFVIGAGYAGAAGVLMAHFARYIAPEDFNLAHSIQFLAMLIIGGEGTIAGAIIGAVLLTFLPEWLRFLGPAYLAFYGALMVIVLVFMPKGIAGLGLSAFMRRKAQP